MPANEFRTDLGYPIISFRADALPAIVDVLRNEKPLFLTWYDYSPTPRFGTIGTSREPAGEAETWPGVARGRGGLTGKSA